MRQSTWLLLRATVPMILAVLAVFVALSLLSTFINELDELDQGSYSLTGALMYTALATPSALYSMLPYGVIIGLLVGLGRLATRQELIALQVGGMSRGHIAGTAMLGAGLVVGLVTGGSEWIGARAEQLADALVANAKQIGLATGAQSGLWMKEGNTILNAGMVVSDEGAPPELWNVRLYRYDQKGQLTELIQSPRAVPMTGHWRLENVTTRKLARGLVVERADRMDWASSLNAELIAARSQRPRQQSIAELRRSIAYAKRNGLHHGVLESAFWYRISHPLSALALAMIALPFVFAQTRSSSFGRQLFVGISLGIGFYFVQRSLANTFEFMGLNLAAGHLSTPLLVMGLGMLLLRWGAQR